MFINPTLRGGKAARQVLDSVCVCSRPSLIPPTLVFSVLWEKAPNSFFVFACFFLDTTINQQPIL